MFKIDDFDVFIFDFDGTIMNTEFTHYLCWKKTIQSCIPDFNISPDEYFKHIHNLDTQTFKKYLYINHNITHYDELYKKKGDFYKEEIEKRYHTFIDNFEMFLYRLTTYKVKKELVIVTNSSISSINLFRDFYPQLSMFKVYTKEDFSKKKPDPECYQKMTEIYKNKRIACFEDSLVGVHALTQVPEITPFQIKPLQYYYNDFIKENYKINIIESYDEIQ